MTEQVAVLNHTGICVSEAERSVRFYTEVFGFQYWREFEPPDEPAAPLLGLEPPLDHFNVYLRSRRLRPRAACVPRGNSATSAGSAARDERAGAHPPLDQR